VLFCFCRPLRQAYGWAAAGEQPPEGHGLKATGDEKDVDGAKQGAVERILVRSCSFASADLFAKHTDGLLPKSPQR
jgi:hypothetical protein